MEDLTEFELDAAEQKALDLIDRDTADDAEVALYLRRMAAEIRRHRAAPALLPEKTEGGTKHEIVLEESTGIEQG